jgi:hypothetical protein
MGRAILTTSAIILTGLGAIGLFGADELARSLLGGSGAGEAVIQVAAAGLLGFAIVNWMSRGNRIGGIYMRPLALGNLLLFTAAGLSLGKAFGAGQLPSVTVAPALAFCGLALAFGWLAFGHDPLSPREASSGT